MRLERADTSSGSVDHTFWFEHYGPGVIYHFDTNGNYLGSDSHASLGLALGGEISSVPEPPSFALAGLGGLGLAFGAYRRSRIAVMS